MVDRLAVLFLFLFLFLPFVIKAQGNRVAFYHTVQQDEWNSKIAVQYQTKVDSLEKWNPDVNSNSLKVGQRIIVGWQDAEVYHIIQKGDFYSKIACQYNTKVDSLLKWNPDVVPNRLMVGQKIIVGWRGAQYDVDKPQPEERLADEKLENPENKLIEKNQTQILQGDGSGLFLVLCLDLLWDYHFISY